MDWGSFLTGGVAVAVAKFAYDWLITRRQNAGKAKFLALQIVYQLEGYGTDLVSKLVNGRNYDSTDGALGRLFDYIPEMPEMPRSEAYPLLDHGLVERIWTLPLMRANAESNVAFEADINGPQDASQMADQEGFIFVDHLFDLAKEIAKRYRLADTLGKTGDWNVRDFVKEEAEKVKQARKGASPPTLIR